MDPEGSEYRGILRLAQAVQRDVAERITGVLDALSDPYLMRARVESTRIKELSSIRRKASQHGWSFREAASKARDIVGFRVVCHNLQDLDRVADLLSKSFRNDGDVTVIDYVRHPRGSDYRAVHLVVRVPARLGSEAQDVHCEIQIRSLVQHAWAELSRADFYASEDQIPASLLRKMKELSNLLARADKAADEIRKQVAKPRRGRRPRPGATLSDSAVAFIFERAFGRHPQTTYFR
jgi:ppGpp synthetase/RelA/SpoT-type nucleotidyltranferase